MIDTPQPLPLVRSEQGETASVEQSPALASAAQRLKQARENAGLHVVALAAMLKVPVKKLEALEAGRYDELTDTTFVRALALSVCRQLKIDSAEILAGLPQPSEVKLTTSGRPVSVDRPVASTSMASGGKTGPIKPAHWAVALLLAATVAWWALPPGATNGVQKVEPVIPPVTPLATESVPQPAPQPLPLADTTAPVLAPGPALASPGPGLAPASAVPEVLTPAPAPTAAVAASASAMASSQAPDASTQLLGIRVRESAWVEVLDASGAIRLQRLLQAGEAVSFQSGGPFTVVTGRADVTDVWVRGQKLEVADRARLNVARFEVK